MSQNDNPYLGSNLSESTHSSPRNLRGGVSSSALLNRVRFHLGYPVIFYGVAFYLERFRRGTLYAAIPNSNASAIRMQTLTDEAVRVLPFFLNRYPELERAVRDRVLIVRMVDNYQTVRTPRMESHPIGDALAIAADPDGRDSSFPKLA